MMPGIYGLYNDFTRLQPSQTRVRARLLRTRVTIGRWTLNDQKYTRKIVTARTVCLAWLALDDKSSIHKICTIDRYNEADTLIQFNKSTCSFTCNAEIYNLLRKFTSAAAVLNKTSNTESTVRLQYSTNTLDLVDIRVWEMLTVSHMT